MFTTHTHDTLSLSGTSLQGEITAKFSELSSLFGKPGEGDGHKVDAEWLVKFDDGTIASIYNWKDGVNYCGEDGTPVEKITDWHVGGVSAEAVSKIQIALDLFREGALKPRPSRKRGLESVMDDVQSARDELLASVAAHHGEKFAQVVEIATMIQRQMDIFDVVVSAAVTGAQPPKALAEILRGSMANVCATIVEKACGIAALSDTKASAKQLIFWSQKLAEAEGTAVAPIMAEVDKRTSQRKGGN